MCIVQVVSDGSLVVVMYVVVAGCVCVVMVCKMLMPG